MPLTKLGICNIFVARAASASCSTCYDCAFCELARHTHACRTARGLVTDVVVKIVSLVAAADHDLYTQLRLGALDLLLGAFMRAAVQGQG